MQAILPVTPRIAVLKIRLAPRRLCIVSCYAPSQLPSTPGAVEQDLQRRQVFWDTLADCIPFESCPLAILMGDFNARICDNLDIPEHVGQFHFNEPMNSFFIV